MSDDETGSPDPGLTKIQVRTAVDPCSDTSPRTGCAARHAASASAILAAADAEEWRALAPATIVDLGVTLPAAPTDTYPGHSSQSTKSASPRASAAPQASSAASTAAAVFGSVDEASALSGRSDAPIASESDSVFRATSANSSCLLISSNRSPSNKIRQPASNDTPVAQATASLLKMHRRSYE